jgi:SAM-dependent methyltransferase
MNDISRDLDPDLWNRKWESKRTENPNAFAYEAVDRMRHSGARTVLELGAGAGRDTSEFLRNGFGVTAVDVSASAVKKLEALGPSLTVVHRDIRELELPEKAVDAVYAFSSLHYFDRADADMIYGNISSVLRDGGLLYVAYRSVNDGMNGKGEKVGDAAYVFNGAVRKFFSLDSLSDYMERLRFEVVSAKERRTLYHEYDGNFHSKFVEIIAKKRGSR